MSEINMIESMLLGEFLRIPFSHQGRGMDGADCYGIIMLWYEKALGIKLLDPMKEYPEGPKWRSRSFFIENYHLQWEKVKTHRKYDVLLFKSLDGRVVNHAGIYLGKNKFMHTTQSTGCVIQSLDKWIHRIEGFYRLRS